MKNVIHKFFHPRLGIGIPVFILGFALLIYVFIFHLEEEPIAYISYLWSTYALTIFCIWFYKACKFSTNFVKENSKLYKTYYHHHEVLTKVSLLVSFFLNFIYAMFKLSSGIYYKSEWFITFAIYYLLLCFMRISLVVSVKKSSFGKDLKKEYQKQKHTGIILLLLDLILSGIIVLIIHQNQTIIYPGYFIYIVAIYDFYLIISAFINVFRYRKQKSPILVASKCINLTVAMISMVSLEVAMISHFGSNDGNFKLIMTACTGFGICVINSFMAIYMVVKANRYLKNTIRI